MIAIAFAFLISAIVGLVFTPLSIRWAWRWGVLARPSARKVHREPIPCWGGVAIVAGVISGAGIGWLFLPELPAETLGLAAGLFVIVAVGSLDDRYSLPAKVKLAGQIVAALLPLAFGVRIKFLNNPVGDGYLFLAEWQAWLLTLLWIVGLINAINLIDGLDGLAAGVSFFAALTLTFLAAVQGLTPVAVAFAAVAGACIGFLPYNFHPARVFMGDTGAMALGYLFATLSVLGAVKSIAALSVLFMTGIMLAYPISDTAFAIFRRWLSRRPIFSADREHLHHRLLDSGFDQRQAVLVLYALTLIFCLLAILLTRPKV
ncbi:putative undecaprenyl-phosphate N-acetylglucosaminyl 1-phosphate transferase [bacterium HR17]|uniref:Putative undecaprenyl-phosphate N-acetylglucosaminyl 1-phosphate transferase n=1 Tax=Candidatus Fervidibacter japonicus TaxID=2035412 RepID=A0A2H5X8L3_9BACT|nr:putative undecaprenyl-phosphate N-acetylglucosaminyl 1-phosphate transferase [bacterium HR17]